MKCGGISPIYLGRGSSVRAMRVSLVINGYRSHSLPKLITLRSATCRNRTMAVAYVRSGNTRALVNGHLSAVFVPTRVRETADG